MSDDIRDVREPVNQLTQHAAWERVEQRQLKGNKPATLSPLTERKEVVLNMTDVEYRVFREIYQEFMHRADNGNSYVSYDDAIADACLAVREAIRLATPAPTYDIKRRNEP